MLVGLFPPAQGGVTTFLLNLVNSYLAESYRFEPFSITRPPKKNVVDNWGYAAFFRGGAVRMALGLLVTAWHLITFPFAVRARGVDIVQVQASDYQQFWEAVLYVMLARWLHRPVLMRLGGAFDIFYEASPAWMKQRIRAAVSRPDLLIVQSEYWRDLLARVGRADRVVILNNFVLEAPIGKRRREVSNAPRCLFIAGSEARRKGLYVLIDALRLLRERGVAVSVLAVAVPEVAAQRIRSEGLQSLVELRGYLKHEEVLAEMRRTEIFLLPSFGEGFPNSLLEAMAQGMAAIATPVGSVREIVGAGDGAIVVAAGDPAALASAIGRLVEQPELCARMGAHNQEVVRSRFTPHAVLPALDAAYRQLLPGAALSP
jgi:glycosyltransferase involved in cell wall biosynthesis